MDGMEKESGHDPFANLKSSSEEYSVYDAHYERIGKVNDRRHLIEVAEEAETIKHAPHFGHDETVLPELEDRVRIYFGLEPLQPSHEPEESHPSDVTSRLGPDDRVDTRPGERMEAQDRLAGEPTREEEPAGAPD